MSQGPCVPQSPAQPLWEGWMRGVPAPVQGKEKTYPDLKLRVQKKPTQADLRWNSPFAARWGVYPE